jgi:hypothetical protein
VIGLGFVKVGIELVPLHLRILVARPEAVVAIVAVLVFFVPGVVPPEHLVVLQRLADEGRHALPRCDAALALHSFRRLFFNNRKMCSAFFLSLLRPLAYCKDRLSGRILPVLRSGGFVVSKPFDFRRQQPSFSFLSAATFMLFS